MRRPWVRTALVLSIFTVVFLALVVGSYRLESATLDEPQHLAAGYTAWKLHDYRIDPEHPPFLRMWAALPLLMTPGIKLDTGNPYWLQGDQWRFSHQFLFFDNDADRLLFCARFMIALLGVLLGILIFGWAEELVGFWPAVIVLGLYCTEPNLVAHSGLVTTDLGATCFIFGAAYFTWRIAHCYSVGNLTGLTVFFALAQISKYSALLLGPVLFALLLLRALSAAPWQWRIWQPKLLTAQAPKTLLATLTIVAVLIVWYAALWGVFGFRYEPTGAGSFVMSDEARNRLPQVARFMQWADEYHLLPNATAQGFASTAARAQLRPGYLLGSSRTEGWWYYFPLAFLIKTPLTLLLTALIGLISCTFRWKTTGRDALFVLGPPAVFFGIAMTSHLNIGLRHVLPVYPFVLLLTGWTAQTLLQPTAIQVRRHCKGVILATLCTIQLVEFATVYPYCLAFFNRSVGGPRHGLDYLVDSNLDWGQGLKLLKRWMTVNHVSHVNLCYFGNAPPSHYGIDYTPLPGTSAFDLGRITRPRLPGYVAISATTLTGAYLDEPVKSLYAPLRQRQPVAVMGYSIYVFQVDAPWW